MKAAMVFTYTRPWPGREALGMEAFTDALTFFGKLAADEKCSEPMLYLETTGRGMMIIHGDREFFADLVHEGEFRTLYIKAGYAVPDMAYAIWGYGEYVEEMMGTWAAHGAALGLM